MADKKSTMTSLNGTQNLVAEIAAQSATTLTSCTLNSVSTDNNQNAASDNARSLITAKGAKSTDAKSDARCIVAVVGARGKMGSLVCAKLAKEYSIVKIDKGDDLQTAQNCDLLIDFASGASSAKSAKFCMQHNIRLVVGATGQTDVEQQVINDASKAVPVLQAGNFSVGIALLKKLTKLVVEQGVDDITIFEKHHKQKKDSPSGTALEIAREIEKLGMCPTLLAERGGKEIGTHEVDLYFGDEVICIKHQAFSRDVFADGAVLAVKFLITKTQPQKYNFEDVLTEKT